MTVMVAGLLIKITAVLCFGALAARALRRVDAGTRHAVWAAALVAVLALPALALLLPSWSAPVPRSFAPVTSVLGRAVTPGVAGQPVSADVPTFATRARPVPRVGSSRGWSLAHVGAGLWLLGSLLIGLLVTMAQFRMRALVRRADPTAADWKHALQRAAMDLGVRRPVRIVELPDVALPATWGVWRPVVLIPAGGAGWTPDRKRAVVLHELAHVLRRDCLLEYVALAACAVYWFHPFVWYAAGQLRKERERACDDLVVAAGTSATEYATHLVDIAASARSLTHPPSALTFAGPGTLEARLRALLDPARAAGAHRVAMRVGVAVALMAVVPALSAMSLVPTVVPVTPGRRAGLVPPDTVHFVIAPAATVRWRGTAVPGDTVSIRAAMGDIVVEPATGADIDVTAVRRTGPRNGPVDTRIAMIRSGRTLAICSRYFTDEGPIAPCEVNGDWGRGSVDDNDVSFNVRVPAGVHLNLLTGLGDISVTAWPGDVKALTGAGVASIAAAGSADIEAYSGAIRYTMLSGSSARPVSLSGKHGDIEIRLAPGVGRDVDASTGLGSVWVDPALGRQPDAEARRVRASIGAGGPLIIATLEKGDIRIGTADR